MPRKEPPAAVDLCIVVVGDRAHGMVCIDMRAPALRIMRIAFGAPLHLADGGLQASKDVR